MEPAAGEGQPVRPLSIAWRDWLQGADWSEGRYVGQGFDAIVVGSGYGGSVAALRLAEKNHRVLVLERGSEYLAGEFPNDFALVPKYVRANVPGRGVPAGRASGLLEVHPGLGMTAVTGNGLGGGSLINAGVLVRPDTDVFAQSAWPAAIRHGLPDALDPFYAKAQAQLEGAPWRSPQRLPKTVAFARFARQLGTEAEPVVATIDPDRCRRCGDCASGCNVPEAKRSLDKTYLRAAVATGRVQVVTQAEVYRFSERRDRSGKPGWTVHAFATDAQQEFTSTREVFSEARGTGRTLGAGMLIVCAGTYGSTQLLQRSQAQSGGTLAFSPALGTRVSGNGDSLSWLTNEPERVGAVGLGAGALPRRGVAPAPLPDVGPTITAAIDLRARQAKQDTFIGLPPQAKAWPTALPLEERLFIEDGAIPRAIDQFFRELLASASTLKQLDGWWYAKPHHARARNEDPLGASAAAADHAQTLLVMGHDGSPARLVWLEGLDRSAGYLPEPEKLGTYVAQQRLFDRFGTRHVHNPLWQSVPRDAEDLMTGEKPPRSIVTVHPLGGCVMGDDPACSVVNHLGQVWVHEPGRGFIGREAIGTPPLPPGREGCFDNEPHLYCGLYVLDGSILPSSLGCNPLWTITALAERAVEAICTKPATASLPPARGDERRPLAYPSHDVPIIAALNEVLMAHQQGEARHPLRFRGALKAFGRGGAGCARFVAQFRTRDIEHAMRTRNHDFRVSATLCFGRDAAAPPEAEYRSQGGSSFHCLPANATSSGAGLFAWCMVQAAVMLAIVLAMGLAWFGAAAVAFHGAPFAWLPEVLQAPPWPMMGWALQLAVLFVVLAVLLPYPRSFLTWLLVRGWRDIEDALHGRQRITGSTLTQLREGLSRLRALAKQLVHASETRVMKYHVPMALVKCAPSVPRPPGKIVLHATKTVTYRATVGELLAWTGRWIARRARLAFSARGTELPPLPDLRPTFWQQVMNAEVYVVRAGRRWPFGRLLTGSFEMGFENLVSSGLSSGRRAARPAMELGWKADVTTGALALASYPLLFLRYAFKTRLLDFRLPAYSDLPVRDQALPEEVALRRAGQPDIAPQLHWIEVPRGTSSSDAGDEGTAPLRLKLWRYRQHDAEGRPRPAEIRSSQWLDVKVARAKVVLLLHAFGQSGLSYTLKTVDENLAESFHARGYEVWVLDSRMSTRSGYATDPCSVDQMAANDVPRAVRHILAELKKDYAGTRPLQIAAFAQCIGSASLWMALLSGQLAHPQQPRRPAGWQGPQLSMLSHAMFSQVHAWVVGARTTQAKTWVPGVLTALWRRGYVPFAVRGPQRGLMMPMLDRVFASMPVPPRERSLYQGHEDAAATCRRIRFIEAPLFRHENLNDATFGAMNLLFGDANLRLFAHARRFVDRERIVDEDGIDRYVTRANLERHLSLPVQLLHGADNELFDASSATQTFARLGATHGEWQQRFCRGVDGQPGPLLVPGYGHLDVLIGKEARQDVFPHVGAFFDACLHERVHARTGTRLDPWVARPPLLGPFVGWLREAPAASGTVPRLRVSFVVDERGELAAATLPPIRVRYRAGPNQPFTTLVPATRWRAFPSRHAQAHVVHRFACNDLELPAHAAAATEWQVLTLHRCGDNPDCAAGGAPWQPLPGAAPTDAELDAFLAQYPAQGWPQGVVPAISDFGREDDFTRARFELPPCALQTLPAGSEVRFGVASCRHPGFGVDRRRVDRSVEDFLFRQRARPVAFSLLLGDQIYADATAGLMDPTSALERYHERHAQAFAPQAIGQLAARMPVYFTPDDHEWVEAYPAGGPLRREAWRYGKDKSGYLRRERQVRRTAAEAIAGWQRLGSPSGAWPRPWYAFAHGCTRFFVMDTRISRRRYQPRMVDPRTLASLQRWLQAPGAERALNVIACGTVVLPGLRMGSDPANPGPDDTWQYAQAQRLALLDLLVDAGRPFMLLSGDYHVSGAAHIVQGGRTVGAAIVAPPVYAPMPYANAAPESVYVDETLPLAGGAATLLFPENGEILRGSAIGALTVRPGATGGFEIEYLRHLRVWEDGRKERRQATLRV